jgi:hypothetical protein
MEKKKESLIMVVKPLIALVEIMVLVQYVKEIDYIKIKKRAKNA